MSNTTIIILWILMFIAFLIEVCTARRWERMANKWERLANKYKDLFYKACDTIVTNCENCDKKRSNE